MVKISDLPTEVLFDIFSSYLDIETWVKLLQTCSWANFLAKRCLGKAKKVDFDVLPAIQDRPFEYLCRDLLELKEAKVNCFYLRKNSLKNLPLTLESLCLINLDKMLKEKSSLFDVLSRLIHLKTLKIHSLEQRKYFADYSKISSFFSIVNLKEFNSQNVYLKDAENRDLAFFNGLEVLKVRNLNFQYFPSTLTKIKICKHELDNNYLGLNDRTLAILSQNCPVLEKLSIIDSSRTEISNNSLKNLLSACRGLKKLNLSRQRNEAVKSINDFTAMMISTQTCSLTSLNLDSFQKLSDAGILEIIKSNQRLESVSLAFTFVTDDTLIALALLPLKKLNLRSCKRISSQGLGRLLNCAGGLKELNLAYAHGVTDEVIESLEDHCRAIEKLVIVLPDISENFKFRLKKFRNIRSLVLGNCGVKDFLFLDHEVCEKVEELSLAGSSGLNDFGLAVICRRMRVLKKLCVRGCVNVSEEGILSVFEDIKKVKVLDIRGIHITTKLVDRLPRLRKNLCLMKISSVGKADGIFREEFSGKFKVLVESKDGCFYWKFIEKK